VDSDCNRTATGYGDGSDQQLQQRQISKHPPTADHSRNATRRGLSRSRRAAAENFITPPPPKNACRRADADAADILFGAPPKRCCHVHFSISCFTSIAVVLPIYRNKS
jgi:hypothetical protein